MHRARSALILVMLLSFSALLHGCGGDQPAAAPADPGDECVEDESRRTQTGLQIVDVNCGTGDEAVSGTRLTVHYEGMLDDGSTFDSSLQRGKPFEFVLGAGKVIPGWDEGLDGMRVGGVRRLVIPPSLGYGREGFPPVIPGNETLTFEVELLEVSAPDD